MSESKEKFKILKVTVEQKYYIPMYDDERSQINGWTMEEIIEDWFKRFSLGHTHATRDGHLIMGAEKFIKAEVEDGEDKHESDED